jgi:tetratricopeptide (TPR) repeat protein
MNGEFQRLAGRLTGLTMRRSGLALGIWGEPGIGKTHAALTLLRGTPCQSLSLHATQSLEMIVRQIPRPKKISIWLERSLERLEAGEPLETGVFIQTLGALLTANAPLILHIEDLHEATPDRLELWQKLALVVTRTRGVGLIATSRAQPPDGFEVSRLEPLNRVASDALLESEAGAALPVEALAWIFEHARGNPLFTLEFFRFLARHGFAWNDAQRWRWRVPERQVMPVTVEAIIEQVITEACPDTETRTALNTRAYLESLEPNLKLEPGLWVQVANLESDALERADLNLRARGVLNESGFVHPLFREVPVKGLSAQDRSLFANRALEVLPLEVAVVFITDAHLGPERSLALLEQAALAATLAGNQILAARFQAKAVDYASDEVRGSLASKASAGLYEHNLAEAIRLAETALKVCPNDLMMLANLISYLAEAGRREDAERLLNRLPLDVRQDARGFSLSIKVAHYLNDSNRVVQIWNAHPEFHTLSTPFTIRNVAYALAELGELSASLGLVLPVLNRPDLSVLERVVLLETCGFACHTSADFVSAERHYSEAINLFRQDQQAHRAGSLLFNRSTTYLSLSRFPQAIADAEEALRLASEGGHVRFVANAQLALGSAWLELGEYERAEEVLLECHAHYQVNDMISQIDSAITLSELYRQWQAPHAGVLALKHSRNAVLLARSTNNPRLLIGVIRGTVFAEVRNGNPQFALILAEEGQQLASQLDFKLTYSTLWARASALQALGRTDEALMDYHRAFEVAELVGSQLDAQKIGLEIASLKGDFESAKRCLTWFESHGLINGVKLVHHAFPKLRSERAGPKEVNDRHLAHRLEALGTMQLLIGGKPEPVRGGKRKEFLAALLEARIMGRSEISRLDLFDTLYPDTQETQASAALSSLVYQLRELCGPDTILSSDGGYALGRVTSDAETFLETGDTRLWRGAYLEGSDLGVGATVRETLHLALRNRAESLLETDPNEVVRVGRLLCSADPYDFESLRLTLRALRASDNHKSLKSTYARARTGLLEIGEVLPERWMDFLETPTGKTA